MAAVDAADALHGKSHLQRALSTDVSRLSLNVTVSVAPFTVALDGVGPGTLVVPPLTLALASSVVGRPVFVRSASTPVSALLTVALFVSSTTSFVALVCTHTPSASVSPNATV